MVTRKKLTWAELKVGVFVVMALALLLTFIINVTWGGKLFSWKPDYFYAKTYLPTVERLKPGAPVWLAGLEVGSVVRIKPVPYEVYGRNKETLKQIQDIREKITALDLRDPNYNRKLSDLYGDIRDKKVELRNVEVVLKIDNKYKNRISVDSEVSIGSQGLIGESYIDISVGSFGVPSKKEFDPDLKKEVVLIEGTITPSFRQIITGANDVIANFGVLSEQVKTIASQIDAEKIGRTISELGTNLDKSLRGANTTFEQAAQLIEEARTGKGTFPRFIQDPQLYNQLTASAKNLDDITARIRAGDGTAARFINDPSIYNNADATVRRVNAMLERIENGQGNLGHLYRDEALYRRMNQTMERLTEVLDRVERGEGTAGKILKDPALYDNLNRTASEMTKLMYDFRQNPKKFLTIHFRIF